MADEIKTGDIVQLKSGGPDMTVNQVADLHGARTVCQNNRALHRAENHGADRSGGSPIDGDESRRADVA